jgi:hypothetical protein
MVGSEAEDLADYLQRMNKQLEEMAAQHLQVTSLQQQQPVPRASLSMHDDGSPASHACCATTVMHT